MIIKSYQQKFHSYFISFVKSFRLWPWQLDFLEHWQFWQRIKKLQVVVMLGRTSAVAFSIKNHCRLRQVVLNQESES